jgi:DNA polymerase-3 subunit epsilon
VTTPLLPKDTLDRLAEILDGRPLVFFDLETTGTDRMQDRIVEIAALRISPGSEVATFDRRVNPGIPIPRESTAVHGISDADVADCPKFPAIVEEVDAFLAGADLAGYNIRGFDVPLLLKEFERASRPFPLEGRRIVDAQTIYFRKEPRDLTAAVRFFAGRAHEGAHAALADVVASAEVLAGQLARYEDLPRSTGGLHEFTMPDEGRWVDPDKRFSWRHGQAVFAFGENRGKKLKDVVESNPGYLQWILRADFPAPAKRIVEEALKGKFPERLSPS